MKKSIYLDYASATPLAPEVLNSMRPYFTEDYFNPSAIYSSAVKVKKDLDLARSQVAFWLGASPSEVIFTAGGTEANNLAIQGIMSQFPEANMLISGIEHDSVLKPAEQYKTNVVNVDKDGRVDLSDLQNKIDDQTVLVSIIYASNEIGTIQTISDIAKIITKVRQGRKSDLPMYLHTDACQAANYLDLHAARLGVDMLTLNGGKIYGPKQSGCLYVKSGVNLAPLLYGGGQERNLRSGTENIASIVGFAKALDLTQSNKAQESKRLHGLQQLFIKQILSLASDVWINGSTKRRLPNNIHLTFPGKDNERLLFALDNLGIMVATGSACSASSDDPSSALKAIGLSDAEAQSSLRITMGRHTSEKNVKETVQTLIKLVNS